MGDQHKFSPTFPGDWLSKYGSSYFYKPVRTGPVSELSGLSYSAKNSKQSKFPVSSKWYCLLFWIEGIEFQHLAEAHQVQVEEGLWKVGTLLISTYQSCILLTPLHLFSAGSEGHFYYQTRLASRDEGEKKSPTYVPEGKWLCTFAGKWNSLDVLLRGASKELNKSLSSHFLFRKIWLRQKDKQPVFQQMKTNWFRAIWRIKLCMIDTKDGIKISPYSL